MNLSGSVRRRTAVKNTVDTPRASIPDGISVIAVLVLCSRPILSQELFVGRWTPLERSTEHSSNCTTSKIIGRHYNDNGSDNDEVDKTEADSRRKGIEIPESTARAAIPENQSLARVSGIIELDIVVRSSNIEVLSAPICLFVCPCASYAFDEF